MPSEQCTINSMDFAKEVSVLARSKYPILYVISWEEKRVEEALKTVAAELGRGFHSWAVTQGVVPAIVPDDVQKALKDLPSELQILAQIRESGGSKIILLKDFHVYLKDSRVIRMLRDLSEQFRDDRYTLVLMAPSLTLPTELEKEVTVLEYPLPDAKVITELIDEAIHSVTSRTDFAEKQIDVTLTPDQREVLVKSAQGLTFDEIDSCLARSFVESKKLDLNVILEEKKQIVGKSGLLEYYPAENSFADVGGHDILKDWLEKRAKAFTRKAVDFGIPVPKGVLLLGVQGCGKSLIAKAIAASWKLPMLKMDVGRIFGSLVGQSEQNIRRAISVAESIAPCCLWADELEKGFAGVSGSGVGDSGTTARVFATFLTWMQEKKKPVFLIATANDVTQLPPELLRKGRFDEIFFIDLPDEDERKEIFNIHLIKRKRDPKNFDLAKLADATDGFSGAEIEQVVVSGLYNAFDQDRDLASDDLIAESKAQVPLSRMMAEEIDELRTWAHLRARPSASRKAT